jgi:(E)-4-hydroxy-3-methyl-but-2-enyl pyrophosphate reductase
MNTETESRIVIRKATMMGHCYGVRKILALVDDVLKENVTNEDIYLCRPLVHNNQLTQRLIERGLKLVFSVDTIPKGAITIVGPHSVNLDELRTLTENTRLIDTTCEKVKRVFTSALGLQDRCERVIFVGRRDHTEAKALQMAIPSLITVQDDRDVPERIDGRAGAVSQSTLSHERFDEIVDKLRAAATDLEVVQTGCDEVEGILKASLELARHVDLMIVVGGYHSHNTKQLAEACLPLVPTKHIETAPEIDPKWITTETRAIGLTAGASTPDWVIDEVERRLKTVIDSKALIMPVNKSLETTPK